MEENNGGQTAARQHVLCGSSSWIAIFQIDSELSPHIWCFFLPMCLCEFVWLVAKESKRFDIGLSTWNLHYLTLQTDFEARWCFRFSANDSSVEQVCPRLVYKVNKIRLFPWPLRSILPGFKKSVWTIAVVHHWRSLFTEHQTFLFEIRNLCSRQHRSIKTVQRALGSEKSTDCHFFS